MLGKRGDPARTQCANGRIGEQNVVGHFAHDLRFVRRRECIVFIFDFDVDPENARFAVLEFTAPIAAAKPLHERRPRRKFGNQGAR